MRVFLFLLPLTVEKAGSKGLGPRLGPRKPGPDRAGRQIRPFAGAIRRPCGRVHPFAHVGTVGVAAAWHMRSAGAGSGRRVGRGVRTGRYCHSAVALPVKTTADDIRAIAKYLKTKPAGATAAEVKAVSKALSDGRKLSAFVGWGVVSRNDGVLTLTERSSASLRSTSGRPLATASFSPTPSRMPPPR